MLKVVVREELAGDVVVAGDHPAREWETQDGGGCWHWAGTGGFQKYHSRHSHNPDLHHKSAGRTTHIGPIPAPHLRGACSLLYIRLRSSRDLTPANFPVLGTPSARWHLPKERPSWTTTRSEEQGWNGVAGVVCWYDQWGLGA